MDRLLVAYDGTPPARRALEAAAAMAQGFAARVSVVSVVPKASLVRLNHRDQLRCDELLDESRRLLASYGLEPELIEPIGNPAEAIERVIETGGFDAVVVGSRGLGPLARLVEGSVSEHLATHAAATVVVVR